MSVGVCVASKAGIAMVADSRRMAERAGPEPRFSIASENARKIFLVGGRFGVATHGQATIGSRTIGDLMDDQDSEADTPIALAMALGTWFSKALDAATPSSRGDLLRADSLGWPLGFVVSGYEGDIGRVIQIKVRPGDYQLSEPGPSTQNPGVFPFGQSDGIDRLLTGIDRHALKQARVSIAEEHEENLELLSYDLKIPEDLASAAEFAESLVGVQLLAQTYSWGTYAGKKKRVPGCGGRIRTLALTEAEGRWLRGWSTNPAEGHQEDPPQADEAPPRAQRNA